VFGIDACSDEDTPSEIEELDSVLNENIGSLSSEVLVEVVRCSLISIYDNYNVANIAINELISRENVDAQNQIVDIYIKSCYYYDAGHRAFAGTVQDMLIDDIFPEFEAEPLVRLLEWCHTDHLYNNGDGMEPFYSCLL
jgi:hypothetical protein